MSEESHQIRPHLIKSGGHIAWGIYIVYSRQNNQSGNDEKQDQKSFPP